MDNNIIKNKRIIKILTIIDIVLILLMGNYFFYKIDSNIKEEQMHQKYLAEFQKEKEKGKKYYYKNKIETYFGGFKDGETAKRVIEEIIKNNKQYIGDSGKFIAIEYRDSSNNVVDLLGNPGETNNNYYYVDTQNKKMNTLSTKIDDEGSYDIFGKYSDSRDIIKVIIRGDSISPEKAIRTYNADIERYIGDLILGDNVSELLICIIKANQNNQSYSGKFTSVEFGTATIEKDGYDGNFSKNTSNFKGHVTDSGSNGYTLPNNAHFGEIGHPGEINNTESFIKDTTSDLETLKNLVDSTKKYTVKAEYSKEGFIIKVIISEHTPEKIDVNSYNSNIEKYVGESQKGSAVSKVIDAIITSNTKNVYSIGKFIALDFHNYHYNHPEGTCLGNPSEKNNNVKYVNEISEAVKRLKYEIKSQNDYSISVEKDKDGFINKVIIQELMHDNL